ncbi:phage minor head protein [Sphingobium bisphenolivorans]|uniref:phage minor head protein n=1 Tax=Sphingobium bisphenolivorans TaxID=1335760 RepID=UPI0003A29DF0|nr:phage minor head protein [Sphingobium bisphenolivorans]
MSEIELQDAILRHALELQRLSANEEARTIAILMALEDELKQLIASRTLGDATKKQIEALIDDAQSAIGARYAEVATSMDSRALVLLVADRTVEAMQEAFPEVTLPTRETLESLSKDVMIDGAPASDWWDKQAEDTAFKFAAQVRQGVINGEAQERIVARIVGRNGEPGIMEVSRRNARALVHSAVMSAANSARLATYRKNSKFTAGIRWLSTLDSHTCLTCAALDGASWDLDGEPIKGTSLDLRFPPAHWNCRCVLSPVPKGLNDIFGAGIDEMIAAKSMRASKDGPVANQNFNDFLKRQSPEFIERVLGVKRAELYRQGKLSLRDLVSGTGRPLTLDELRAA